MHKTRILYDVYAAQFPGHPTRRGLLKSNPYGTSRLRPFARRRLSTLRPAFVLILARKPWVFFRFLLLGWKVLFIFPPHFPRFKSHQPSTVHPTILCSGQEYDVYAVLYSAYRWSIGATGVLEMWGYTFRKTSNISPIRYKVKPFWNISILSYCFLYI